MTRTKFLIFCAAAFAVMACGDNIRGPETDSDDDGGACLTPDCPTEGDLPDAGMPVDGNDQDGGNGGGADGGADGGSDGGSDGECGTCPDGQVCVEGSCVSDDDDEDSDSDSEYDSDSDCDEEGHHPKSCDSGMTLVCHSPPGNPDKRHEICVGDSAVPAHLGHGDSFGACL